MASNTPNINLVKPTANEFYNLAVVNGNSDKIDTAVGNNATDIAKSRAEKAFYAVDSNSSANAKLLTIPGVTAYTTDLKIAFRNNINNTSTNINIRINGMTAKMLYKADGTNIPAGSLKANTIYHMVYDGTAFFLLGDAVEYGTAAASQVLSGYTFATESGLVSGSINTKQAQTYTPGKIDQTISSGQYLGGNQLILGDTNLDIANIRYGKEIFGLSGLFSEDATARPRDVKYGEVFYHKGDRVVGTAPIVEQTIIVPKTTNQRIDEGSFLNGSIDIPGDTNFLAHNIKRGINLFGLTGTGPGFTSGTGDLSNNEYTFYGQDNSNTKVSFQARRGSIFSLPFVPKVVIAIARNTYQGVKPTTIYIEGHQFYNTVATPIMATGLGSASRGTYPVYIDGEAVIGSTVRLPMLYPTGTTGLQFDWFAFTY